MRFQGFCGNREAVSQLSGLLEQGKFPHAVLIDGPEGSGKKTLAGILARAAVCEASGGRPCGRCRACLNAIGGNHPDILRYASGSGPRSFPVDTVRKIRMDAYIAPNESERKVYLLFGAHNMSEQAQNALLKILEEPPEHALFILTCEGRMRVLPTVQSRCVLITLGPVSEEEAVSALLEKLPDKTPEEVLAAVRFSGNLIGRAEQALREGGISEAVGFAGEFASALCGRDAYRFLRLSGTLEKDRALFSSFLGLLPLMLRDAAARGARSKTGISGCDRQAGQLSSCFSVHQLMRMVELSLDAGAAAQRYANTTLLLTDLFSRLWQTAQEEKTAG